MKKNLLFDKFVSKNIGSQNNQPLIGAGLSLDVGCGRRKVEGSIGLDQVLLVGVDVVASLERALPFADNSFNKLYAHHILEHISALPKVLAELHRISCPAASIHVIVPYFTCIRAFGDPTHVRFFTYRTFEHFTDSNTDAGRHNWFSSTRFEIKHRWLGFGKFFRSISIEWWANRWPNIYENFFPYILPARTLEIILTVKK